jgi:hypothetical protein
MCLGKSEMKMKMKMKMKEVYIPVPGPSFQDILCEGSNQSAAGFEVSVNVDKRKAAQPRAK